jgi:hypothetical protein
METQSSEVELVVYASYDAPRFSKIYEFFEISPREFSDFIFPKQNYEKTTGTCVYDSLVYI